MGIEETHTTEFFNKTDNTAKTITAVLGPWSEVLDCIPSVDGEKNATIRRTVSICETCNWGGYGCDAAQYFETYDTDSYSKYTNGNDICYPLTYIDGEKMYGRTVYHGGRGKLFNPCVDRTKKYTSNCYTTQKYKVSGAYDALFPSMPAAVVLIAVARLVSVDLGP